jgi:hypothetical protein
LLPESASRERAHMALGATDTGRSDKPQAERPKKRGLRARWPGPGSWPLEKEACESLQLDLYKVAIRARQVPRKQDLLDLIDLLSSLSYPALIHCKSGADRTGFVAAVYLIAVEGRSLDEAQQQLSLRFGHLRYSRAGVLRQAIEAYGRDRGADGMDFRAWVDCRYDPDEVALRFRPRSLAVAFTERLFRREG